METAINLVKQNPETISAVVVGSEVLLRKEMTAADLAGIIRSVKARVAVPVTYADVWEYWLRNRDVGASVDFITIHVLPYWEDVPIAAGSAVAHVDNVRRKIGSVFPDKEILIGEAGWPGMGRMRAGALPSRINQAKVVSGILALGKAQDFRISVVEAYDQPWKRRFEGTVGGNWGLIDAPERAAKYPLGVPIGNYPRWKMQMGLGMGLSALVFAAALISLNRSRRKPRLAGWLAVALSATVAGALLGMVVDNMAYQSYGVAGLFRTATLFTAAIAAPLICACALVSGCALPTFLELIGPRSGRTKSRLAMLLGATLLMIALIGTEEALGLAFDPRYRDFPFAPLTMAVIPVSIIMALNRPRSGSRPLAEACFAGLFVLAALYIGFNEGAENWQSLWTCAILGLLGITLWQARTSLSSNEWPQDPKEGAVSFYPPASLFRNAYQYGRQPTPLKHRFTP
jgi:glucan 1,3-beta-glucosidase